MRVLAVLAAVAVADATMSLDSTNDFRRALQAHGRGVADTDICGHSTAAITARVGTLHDDQTDETIDCSQGGCGGLDAGHNGYSDNLDCTKTITGGANQVVSLVFTHFNLEMCATVTSCDYIEVFDGASASSPSLGQFSGPNLPSVIRSTGNSVTVHFHTDGGNAQISGTDDPGFYLDWHFIEVLNNQGICAAPAIISDSSGVIHDDQAHGNVNCGYQGGPTCGYNQNEGYGDALNCYITLQAGRDEQVELGFTQLNLEGTNHAGCGSCPDGGCDYVAIYDGADENAPLIGHYTGNPAQMPTVVSSGNVMHIRFMTDSGNCNIEGNEDPGFFAQWTFLENGQNICEPSAAVLHDRHGVLHDDAVGHVNCDGDNSCNGADTGANGYGDNNDCGVRIRAAKNSVVNLKFDQLNLEGGQNGFCGGQIDCSAGGDYVEIYDGRSETAPLLGHLTGSMTDAFAPDGSVVQENYADSFTSTGRDMYVRFVTDVGNYGLQGTTADPGFYASWTAVREGAACQAFTPVPSTGLVGHNNEDLTDVSLSDCETACCARPWCKSFDFMAGPQGPTAKGGRCELADLDASNDYGKVVSPSPWTLYERNGAPPATGTLGAAGCAAQLLQISDSVNAECCPAAGCDPAHPPRTCSEECSGQWLPFSRECSQYLAQAGGATAALGSITQACEQTEYGKYHAGSNHGRCSDGDQQQWIDELGPACCGDNLEYCPGYVEHQVTVPMQGGQMICGADCADTLEQMYAECHPRWEAEMDAQTMGGLQQFLAVCQGMPTPAQGGGGRGGGHRRQLMSMDAPPATPGTFEAQFGADVGSALPSKVWTGPGAVVV